MCRSASVFCRLPLLGLLAVAVLGENNLGRLLPLGDAVLGAASVGRRLVDIHCGIVLLSLGLVLLVDNLHLVFGLGLLGLGRRSNLQKFGGEALHAGLLNRSEDLGLQALVVGLGGAGARALGHCDYLFSFLAKNRLKG